MNTISLRYIIISLLIFIIGQTGLVRGFRNMTSAVIAPVQYGLTVVGGRVKDTVMVATHILSLKEENRQLREEIETLRGELTGYKELEAENVILREQLRLTKDMGLATDRLLAAEVIGRPTVEGSYLVIGGGSADGVISGNPVVYKKYLVGVVVETEDHRAKVRTVFDSQFKVAAQDLDSPTRTRGVVRGEFSTSLIMEKILPSEEVAPGDTIVTSGEDGAIKSLILGRVSEVSKGEAQVLKWARLTPFVDPLSLEKVFVVLP